MKNLYLLIACVLSNAYLFSQTTILRLVPESSLTTTQVRAPNGLTSQTTMRAHFVLTATEMASVANGISIESLGFQLTDGVTGGAGGTFSIYLENTSDMSNLKSNNWATAISTMALSYSGNYTIPVGATPTSIDFTLSTPFVYTGGGVYVAYEYLGSTFSADPATYAANTEMAGAVKMVQTGAGVTTPGATLSEISAYRPQIRFIYDNPYANEVEVNELVIERGFPNPLSVSSQTVEGLITNSSIGDLNNVNVTLDVTGANPYSNTQVIPFLAAGTSQSVSFSGLTFSNIGSQVITLSVPADDNNTNNSLSKDQIVSCDTMAYVTNEAPYTNIGFNTGAGLLAVKMTTGPNIQTRIRGVKVFIADGAGNSVKGILLNSNGVIIDSSVAVVLNAGQIDTEVYFPFIGTTYLPGNSDFYVALRQTAATPGYYPVGSQQPATALPDRIFSFGVNGGVATEITNLGNLMIKAVVQGRFQAGQNPANGIVCEGDNAVILTTSGFSNYEFFVDNVSVQSSPSGSYTYTPTATSYFYATASVGACMFTSPVDSFNVKQNVQNAISATYCTGSTYQFGTQTLNSPGVYTETFPAANTCDSVVTLTLSETSFDNSASVNGMTMTATQSGAGYQWIDCATNLDIPGENGQSYTATTLGSYAVIVSNGNCSDTSACMNVLNVGINEIGSVYSLKVYPSPADDLLNISVNDISINSIQLVDLNGKVLLQQNIASPAAKISVENLVSGVYLINIDTDAGIITRRFVKK